MFDNTTLFEDGLNKLLECEYMLEGVPLSALEAKNRKELLKACARITHDFYYELDE